MWPPYFLALVPATASPALEPAAHTIALAHSASALAVAPALTVAAALTVAPTGKKVRIFLLHLNTMFNALLTQLTLEVRNFLLQTDS